MVVSFHELAERELNDAARYYDTEQPGLGARFIADVQHCTDAILEYPEAGSWARSTPHVPEVSLRVLYTSRPGAVRVLAVMNLRRRPTYWVGRS